MDAIIRPKGLKRESTANGLIKRILKMNTFERLEESAKDGDIVAQLLMGEIYFGGIKADEYFFDTIARVWIIGARMKGAVILECDKEPDYDEAKRWYSMAEKQGSSYAAEKLEAIKRIKENKSDAEENKVCMPLGNGVPHRAVRIFYD